MVHCINHSRTKEHRAGLHCKVGEPGSQHSSGDQRSEAQHNALRVGMAVEETKPKESCRPHNTFCAQAYHWWA